MSIIYSNNNFCKSLLCKVQLYLGSEYETQVKEVTKNNGVILTGIMAKKENSNIYLFGIDSLSKE